MRRSRRLQMFFEIGVLRNFAVFTRKHFVSESLFDKVAGLGNFMKKRLE